MLEASAAAVEQLSRGDVVTPVVQSVPTTLAS